MVCVLLVALPTARPSAGAPFAYITNFDGGTVTVLDLATNGVVTTVAVDPNP